MKFSEILPEDSNIVTMIPYAGGIVVATNKELYLITHKPDGSLKTEIMDVENNIDEDIPETTDALVSQ